MANSAETILTFKTNDNNFDNMSDWSTNWSTGVVPGMDMATGGGSTRRRTYGRRRLRLAALTVGCFLSMHARVAAAALTGGYFVFVMLLILAVAMVANPLRQFEVYVGQWSLSGPGRAFRIIPMFDGIGIAICIHAIFRAIICVVLAGIMAIYIRHSISDKTLPYTYCRNMDLKPYEAETRHITKFYSFNVKDIITNPRRKSRRQRDVVSEEYHRVHQTTPKGLSSEITYYKGEPSSLQERSSEIKRYSQFCNETYPNNYPPIFIAPAYNYFYVELVHYRPDHNYFKLNMDLLYAVVVVWVVLWVFMIAEKISHGRMIWNNMYPWLLSIPWIWAALLLIAGASKFINRDKPLRNIFRLAGHKEVLDFLSDIFVTAIYIHAAALGSEHIHGKGLNYFASGHIDNQLNSDNVWHSFLLLIMATLSTGGVTLCALTDYMQMKGVSDMKESTLWVVPLISKCTVGGNHAHILSMVLFFGLMMAYMIVAFVCLKSALHTIFEYRVKLVFVEQLVVFLLIVICMGLSVIFTSNAGLGLLECIDVMLAGVATPIIAALETVALLWVYRSHDFMSDMHVATEENACASRFSIQWQIMPVVQVILLVVEALMVANSELPGGLLIVGAMSVVIILLALPLRACYNAYNFLQPRRPH